MLTDERTNEQISAAIAKLLLDQLEGHEWKIGEAWVSWKDLASGHNAALGLVVPEMRKLGYSFWMRDIWPKKGESLVGFGKGGAMSNVILPYDQLPRAICLAAEAALNAERKAE